MPHFAITHLSLQAGPTSSPDPEIQGVCGASRPEGAIPVGALLAFAMGVLSLALGPVAKNHRE